MKKFRVYIIAAIILILIIVAIMALRSYYLFLKEPVAPLAGAIPTESALIVNARSFGSFAKIMQSSALAGLLEERKNKPGFTVLAAKIDSLCRLSSFFREIIDNNEFMIAVVPDSANLPEFLYATSIGKTKPSGVSKQLASLFPGLRIDKVQNKPADLFRITSGETAIWYYVYRGILAFSYSREILRQSMNTMISDKTLLDDPLFKRLIETSGKRVDGVLLINNSRLMEMALQKTDHPLKFAGSPFTGWTTLDLKIEAGQVLMDGFTSTGTSGDLFAGQEPMDESLLKYFPRETAFAISLSISNQELFTRKFCQSDTMQLNGYDSANRIASKEIFRRNEHLNAWIGQGVGIAAMPEYFRGNQSAIIMLISVKNPDSARLALKPYLEPYHQNIGILRANNFTGRLWGKLFSLTGRQYCYISDQVVALSPSPELLDQYAINAAADRLMGTSSAYSSITGEAGEKSNVFIYAKPPICKNYLKRLNEGEQYSKSKSWATVPSATDILCLQYSAGGPMLYTHAFALLGKGKPLVSAETDTDPIPVKSADSAIEARSKDLLKETEKTAETKTRSAELKILSGPMIVKGKKASEKRIVLFTANDQMQVFSSQGDLLWSFRCKGKPIEPVTEIDYYRNGGLQYLVATDIYLHLIDSDGKELKTSPVKVPGGISGSVAVFDYDRNRKYRIMYQGKDKKLYNITLRGENLPGWQKPDVGRKTDGPALFFRTAGKDFIVYADNKGKLSITDRRGNVRISVPDDFRKSANSAVFVNTSNNKGIFLMAAGSGKLAYIDGSGRVSESSFGDHGNNPGFNYLDFDGDGSNDFIFSGKGHIAVYSKMKKVISETSLKNADFGKPFISDFPTKEKWLAARDKRSGRVIVLNSQGKQPNTKNLYSDSDPVIIKQGKKSGAVLVTVHNGKPEYTPLK